MGISSILRHENNQLSNILVTFMEVKDLELRENVRIRFNRLNHAKFQWRVEIGNRERSRKKVIVRIFMVILKTPGDPTSFTNKEPMLMDKFAHNLSGEEKEELIRESTENTLSMIESELTVERLTEEVTGDGTENKTWCGIPMNLYLPKSSEQGKDFLIMAFVHDVDQDVVEGLDGVQHVMCGHKDINIKMDSRGFGFPFDREFDFNLHASNNRLSSFAHQEIKIFHRPTIMSDGSEGWEDLKSLQPRSTEKKGNTTTTTTTSTEGSDAERTTTKIPTSTSRTLKAENTKHNHAQPSTTTERQPDGRNDTKTGEETRNSTHTHNGANSSNSSSEGSSSRSGTLQQHLPTSTEKNAITENDHAGATTTKIPKSTNSTPKSEYTKEPYISFGHLWNWTKKTGILGSA